MNDDVSDEELLEGFKKRFSTALPLKYFDIVFIKSLEPKPESVHEPTGDEVEDGEKQN